MRLISTFYQATEKQLQCQAQFQGAIVKNSLALKQAHPKA
jgi:hypothetical protein